MTGHAVSLPQDKKTPLNIDDLCRKYTDKKAVIGIIGMGYVGIPLSCASCSSGLKTLGFDIDPAKVVKLNNGESYVGNIHSDKLKKFVSENLLEATDDFSRMAEADALLMCVPTPLTQHREPDLSYVKKTAESIAKNLRPGQLIILESTTYPGTMRDVVKPILEKTGLKSGEDFYLAYSPEREDPGNIDFETSRIPKVVGGDGKNALKLACTMYEQFVAQIVPVSSPETAEAVKLTENIFRSVNIALVNEMKIIYDALGIDIWEVVDAAKTKPFGYMPFYPGPGLGGHCIPIDPFYLTYKAREHEITTRFIELAGEINIAMPNYVISRTAEVLDNQTGRGFNGSKILLLGAAYKKNVSDDRESPFYVLADHLQKRGATIDYHDPHIPQLVKKRQWPGYENMISVNLTPEKIAGYDLVIIVTNHDDIDYAMIGKYAKIIIDTRNAMAAFPEYADRVFKA